MSHHNETAINDAIRDAVSELRLLRSLIERVAAQLPPSQELQEQPRTWHIKQSPYNKLHEVKASPRVQRIVNERVFIDPLSGKYCFSLTYVGLGVEKAEPMNMGEDPKHWIIRSQSFHRHGRLLQDSRIYKAIGEQIRLDPRSETGDHIFDLTYFGLKIEGAEEVGL